MSKEIPVEIAAISRRPIAQHRRVRAELFAALHAIAPELLPLRYGTHEPPLEVFRLEHADAFVEATSVGAIWECADGRSEGSISCRGESTYRFTSVAIQTRCVPARLSDFSALATIWSLVLDADLAYVSPSPTGTRRGAYLTWYRDDRTPIHWFNVIGADAKEALPSDAAGEVADRIGTHALLRCDNVGDRARDMPGGSSIGEAIAEPWNAKPVPTLNEAWQLVLGSRLPSNVRDAWPLTPLVWESAAATPLKRIKSLTDCGFELSGAMTPRRVASNFDEGGFASPHSPPSGFVAALAERGMLRDFRLVDPDQLKTSSDFLAAVNQVIELIDGVTSAKIEVRGDRGVLSWLAAGVQDAAEFNYFPQYFDEAILRRLSESSVAAGGPPLYLWHLDDRRLLVLRASDSQMDRLQANLEAAVERLDTPVASVD